ncbi:copper chaperone PCu(A)C [Erythrobacter sp. BLCC-B19]|uniref:copper chaperone PCu(A)C n=1 Tax=Erythrobacter sp. BLCC-B19 TaxID=3025315 RepID=UPI002360CF9A|nr:copper chaperone PCu(A)C [Erythrobacter sp. BLCC-B19]WDA40660.1 copper chaperone PCu(A)C [Erythrobacter sp. BLCC-B19]
MKTICLATRAVCAAALLAGVAACAPDADAPTQAEPRAVANAGLTVSNARIVLAPVAGNPAAAYFDLSYNGKSGVSLTGVEVEGAGMTMIHDYANTGGKAQMVMADSVPLTEGAPVTFAPGGLHVMAMEPTDALKPGGTARLTLILSDQTKVTVDAPVKAAGDER